MTMQIFLLIAISSVAADDSNDFLTSFDRADTIIVTGETAPHVHLVVTEDGPKRELRTFLTKELTFEPSDKFLPRINKPTIALHLYQKNARIGSFYFDPLLFLRDEQGHYVGHWQATAPDLFSKMDLIRLDPAERLRMSRSNLHFQLLDARELDFPSDSTMVALNRNQIAVAGGARLLTATDQLANIIHLYKLDQDPTEISPELRQYLFKKSGLPRGNWPTQWDEDIRYIEQTYPVRKIGSVGIERLSSTLCPAQLSLPTVISNFDGTRVYATSAGRNKLQIFDCNIKTGLFQEVPESRIQSSPLSTPTCLAISTESKFLYVNSSGNRRIVVYDITEDPVGAKVVSECDYSTLSGDFESLTISKNGRSIIGFTRNPSELRMFSRDPESGKIELSQREGEESRENSGNPHDRGLRHARAFAISAAGDYAVVAGEESLSLWSIANGQVKFEYCVSKVNCRPFSEQATFNLRSVAFMNKDKYVVVSDNATDALVAFDFAAFKDKHELIPVARCCKNDPGFECLYRVGTSVAADSGRRLFVPTHTQAVVMLSLEGGEE